MFHTDSSHDKMHGHCICLLIQSAYLYMCSLFVNLYSGVYQNIEKVLHLTLKRRLPFAQGNEVQLLLQTLHLVLQPQHIMTPHWMREHNRLSILGASRLGSVCPWSSLGIPAWTCGSPPVGASSLWDSMARFWFLNIHFSHQMDKQANKQKVYIFLL